MEITNYTYGEEIREQNNAAVGNSYKFTEKERDTETGYDYFGARYYSSRLGRWLSVDPLLDKYPGLSPFNYTLNNPINNYDPDGKQTRGILKRLIKYVKDSFSPSVQPENVAEGIYKLFKEKEKVKSPAARRQANQEFLKKFIEDIISLPIASGREAKPIGKVGQDSDYDGIGDNKDFYFDKDGLAERKAKSDEGRDRLINALRDLINGQEKKQAEKEKEQNDKHQTKDDQNKEEHRVN